ncbi:unnamed protein product [Cuscuta campestris]|uniref:CCHC-type domain-containing protein n=1 Tax=Cuscuta campestris TaxID=132261 RepID=A0A484N680_9ASTE|nr:unnamed protein product [Cuscuta campestris]
MSHEELIASNTALKAQVEYLAKEVAKLTKMKLNELQGSDREEDVSSSGTMKPKATEGSDFKVDIPTFEGKNDPDEFLEWLETVERVFDFKDVSDEKKEYEMFGMKEGEKIDDMFKRFSKIINDLHALKKTYANKDLKKGIALKATKETVEEVSSDDDNEFGLVIKKFHKFMKKEFERKGRKHDGPPKCYGCGEIGHIKPRCPRGKNGKDKPGFKKKRAYISWGGDSGYESTDQEEDEAANLCLMAHEDQTDDIQEEGLGFDKNESTDKNVEQTPRQPLKAQRIGEGQSTSRPPLFNGTNYTYWKERMRIYIRSTNFQLWLVIKNGEEMPMKNVGEKLVPKTEDEFDAEDIKKVENYAKVINMLYCAVNPDDYRKISCCTTTKEMWDKLEVTYEGTDQVREAKIDFLTQEYEMFGMKEGEKIDDMFKRFSKIINDLHALKKTYANKDLMPHRPAFPTATRADVHLVGSGPIERFEMWGRHRSLTESVYLSSALTDYGYAEEMEQLLRGTRPLNTDRVYPDDMMVFWSLHTCQEANVAVFVARFLYSQSMGNRTHIVCGFVVTILFRSLERAAPIPQVQILMRDLDAGMLRNAHIRRRLGASSTESNGASSSAPSTSGASSQVSSRRATRRRPTSQAAPATTQADLTPEWARRILEQQDTIMQRMSEIG